MFIYEPESNSHVEIPIPKMTMVSQSQCFLPLVHYFNPLSGNGNYYFYLNEEPSLESFEKDLKRCLGADSLEPTGQGRIAIYSWDGMNVDNKLPFVNEGLATKEISGLYDATTRTLVVGTSDDILGHAMFNNSTLIQTVYSSEYITVEPNKSARVLYQTEYGLDFRYAWNIELLSASPTLYILGTTLSLINGVKLEFITPVFNSKSMSLLKSAIYRMYQLDDSCVANMNVFPITVAHVSEEVEDINNANRIDKYNVIMDMTFNYAYIRSLKDINPLFSQAKGLPNPTPNNRLMPVYSF